MSAKRDSPIVRTPSRESLAVHPLLNTHDTAKHFPYTPRQRVQPASQGSTAHKPHLANLRAAALAIGLDANSIGYAILEKISYEGDTSDEWSEIWNALTKSRVSLLLPSEPCSSQDAITPEFVQDHLVLCDLASRDNTALVSLSGLRGHLVDGTITFRSTLHRSAKVFQNLLAPAASRAASLNALPPLPPYPLESSYPSYSVTAFNATLPLPSRATKPPLPPRPGARGASAPSSARLSMPFASLFGQRPATPPPPPPPPPPLPPATTTTTAVASTSTTADADAAIDISAFVIDAVITRADIATTVISALKGEIAVALNDQPPWLVERVHTFALPYFPFVKLPAGKKKLQDIGGNPNRVAYAVNGTLDKPDELADKFQAFYRAMEDELRNGGHAHVQGNGSVANGPQAPESEEGVDETWIRDVLEMIEATLCTLLYDRLFLPFTSDDASHNEALSSRIAALNMLDLGLEHLDIDIGDANHAEVDTVVRTCGQTLAQLDLSARSPREKASVLVCAHKLVVEGLSNIPPIHLKSHDGADEVPMKLLSGPDIEATEHAKSPSTPSIHLSSSPDYPSAITQAAPPPTSSPVSGDILLPILIFSVVKANPCRLISHLLFIQRFRNQSFGGEESYCLINLMAVAEFLENVDLGALGLRESEKKVPSTADLTPIPITRPKPDSPIAASGPSDEHLASLRGRVEQGVDAIAGSANKVISGVVDTSFGVLRALLPGQTGVVGTGGVPAAVGTGAGQAAGTGAGGVRPTLGLLRRDTGFSIAGLTAALPGPGKGKSQQVGEEGQRELVEVASRPSSLRSYRSAHEESEDEGAEGEEDEDGKKEGSTEDGAEAEEGGEGNEVGEEGEEEEEVHDTRSIKSFESMLSSGRNQAKGKKASGAPSPASLGAAGAATITASRRKKRLTDLTGRLTHGVVEMSRRVQGGDAQRVQASAAAGRLPPPNRRFVECTEHDLRVSEVGELLGEYQRLVEAVRSSGGFQE